MSALLIVCLYPINVKTAELIGPKFFKGPHMTPGKVMDDKNFKTLPPTEFSIFIEFKKSTKKYFKIHELFFVIVL